MIYSEFNEDKFVSRVLFLGDMCTKTSRLSSTKSGRLSRRAAIACFSGGSGLPRCNLIIFIMFSTSPQTL
jgi:hypothetical protein